MNARPLYFLLSLVLLLPGCPRKEQAAAPAPSTAANATRGAALMTQYGCPSCHIIPGTEGPRGTVGPSLKGIGSRPAIGGRFPNNHDTMVRWLENPQSLDPQTSMPNLGVTSQDAEDMAAFLATEK